MRDTVNEFYDGYLSPIDNLATFKIIRQLPAIAEALRGFSDESIFAGKDYGYGILLYTGSSGSEGTLGGLVQVGKRIESILANALEFGRLCSNDPVCAQHKPAEANEERFLHGAACHGYLLIAETSCEKGNEFLVGEASPLENRALVVNTVENQGAAFFPDFL